jgi:hypothetical protein
MTRISIFFEIQKAALHSQAEALQRPMQGLGVT